MELRQGASEAMYEDEEGYGCRLGGKLIGLWMGSVKRSDRRVGADCSSVRLNARVLPQQTRIGDFCV